jgi:hypothetical protein
MGTQTERRSTKGTKNTKQERHGGNNSIPKNDVDEQTHSGRFRVILCVSWLARVHIEWVDVHNPRDSAEGDRLGVLEGTRTSSKALVSDLRIPRDSLEGARGSGLETGASSFVGAGIFAGRLAKDCVILGICSKARILGVSGG